MNSRQWTVLACVVGAVVLLCVIAPVVIFGGVIAAACVPAATPSVAATADGEPGRWDAEQTTHATTIVTVGADVRVPPRGWVIAVAAAMQESNLRNLGHLGAGNDHDSLGLFQQRPSQGWGTPEQIMDPQYAAGKFYEKLLAVPRWQAMPLTEAAQAVQRSAYPDAYAKHEQAATVLVNSIAGGQACGEVGPSGWVMPVDGPIVSGFRTPERPGHDGIDIAAPKGAAIRAAAAGVVTVIRCNASLGGAPYSCDVDGSPAVAGCGWYLEVLHGPNLITRYCHMLMRPAVVEGQPVAAGQPVGLVGTSGHSSGPHLHWEVHLGQPATESNAVDPVGFLDSVGVPVSRL